MKGQAPSEQLGKLAGVPKTLCIPLWARAQAATLTPNLTDFDDPRARHWCDEIGVDPSWITGDPMILKSCVARARRLDDITKRFLQDAGNRPVTVVSIGAGLCSRMDRLGLTARIQNGDPALQWIDLDLPEVIALRTTLRPPTGSHTYISKSLADPTWTDRIPSPTGRRILLLIEGVLVYLPASDVRNFFGNTARALATAGASEIQFAFDVLDGPALKGSSLSSSIRRAGARLAWAPWNLKAFLTQANPHLKLKARHDIISDLSGLLPSLHSLYRITRGVSAYSVAEVEWSEPPFKR